MKLNVITFLGLVAADGLAAPPAPAGPKNDGIGKADCFTGLCGCDGVNSGYWCDAQISHRWGPYAPFFSVDSRINPHIPLGCDLTFVQILSRHGARYPTRKKQGSYKKTINQIQTQAKQLPWKYMFLQSYQYDLGLEDVTPFGEQEMVNSGTKFYNRYQDLARYTTPFFRAASDDRVVTSARKFAQGFHDAKDFWQGRDPNYPYQLLVIPVGRNQNNTLAHGICTTFEDGPKYGSIEGDKFAAEFVPPIRQRINSDLGMTLAPSQIIDLMDLCPMQTVGDKYGRISHFCDLFTTSEWRDYAHLQTLIKYYQYGAGNPLGPTQGVGWTNELIARLLRQPVKDSTSTNHSLDSNNQTFPIGRTMYADFSHDTDMTSIFYAMGLYDHAVPDRDNKNPTNYAADTAVPFAGRMYIEKMRCDVALGDRYHDNSVAAGKEKRDVPPDGAKEAPPPPPPQASTQCFAGCKKGPELVRVLINDRVVPLRNCNADKHGRCVLDDFVASLKFAQEGGEWDKCVNRTESMPVVRPAVRIRPRGTVLDV